MISFFLGLISQTTNFQYFARIHFLQMNKFGKLCAYFMTQLFSLLNNYQRGHKSWKRGSLKWYFIISFSFLNKTLSMLCCFFSSVKKEIYEKLKSFLSVFCHSLSFLKNFSWFFMQIQFTGTFPFQIKWMTSVRNAKLSSNGLRGSSFNPIL